MTAYLVTYDLKETKPDPHQSVRTHAEKKGLTYLQRAGASTIFKLPDTSLWGDFASVKAAWKAFDDAVAAAGVVLNTTVIVEKLYITTITDTDWEPDKKKAADPKLNTGSLFNACRQHQLHDPCFQ